MRRIGLIFTLLAMALIVVACQPTEATTFDFSYSASVGGSVTGTTIGSYDEDTEITITATADSGYEFDGWYVNGTMVSSALTYTFTLGDDITVEAIFEVIPTPTYTFDVSATTGGSVSGTNSGTYDENTSISVTAEANEGYTFDGWFNASTLVSSDSTYTFALTANTTITAQFSVTVYPALSAPTNVTYDQLNQKITWDAVTGASGYIVSAVIANGSTVTIAATETNSTEFSVLGLTDVAHDVMIVAKGVDGESEDSPATTFNLTIVANPLSSPTTFTFDQVNDLLSWDDISGSDGYLVVIKDDNDNVVLTSDGNIETTLSTASLGSGDYTVELTAYAPLNQIYFDDSNTITLDIQIESLGTLANPSNVAITDGYLTWDTVDSVEVVVTVYLLQTTVEITDITANYFDANHLFLNDLNITDGDYTIGIAFSSNRHDTALSEQVTFDFTLETVATFSAADIATFSGETADNGEHAEASLVTVNGVDYARVVPTADGWGRVASPQFTVNYSNNPIVLLKIGNVIGGYHMQLLSEGSLYSILGDTFTQGGRNINIVEGNEQTLVGSGPAVLRLGVNQYGGSGTSDVAVDYQYVTVSYVSEYQEEVIVETLDDVSDVTLNYLGRLVWTPITNANQYIYYMTDYNDNVVLSDSLIESPSIDVRTLDEGIYKVYVKAHNSDYDTTSQNWSTAFIVEVTNVITYSAADIAGFSGENVTAGLDPENSNLAIINSGAAATYGWVFPATGVSLNMDKNPFIITEVDHVNGGYFYFGQFDNQSQYPYKGDTPGDIASPTTWIYRANVNVDRQTVDTQDFSGPVTGFKVRPGVWHPGGDLYSQVWISEIRIVYVEEYQETVVPTVVENATTPSGFGLNALGLFSWSAVSVAVGAPDPSYSIVVTNESDALDTFTIESQSATSFSLANYSLTAGATYSVQVKVLGDASGTSNEDLWYHDSDFGTASFTYTEIFSISDFSAYVNSFVMAGGDFTSTVSLGTNNSLILTTPGDGWNRMDVQIDASSLGGTIVDGSTAILFRLGETSGSPVVFFGFVDASASFHNFIGDTAVSNNQLIATTSWVHPSMVVSGESSDYIQFGLGFGGAPTGVRSYEIVEIVIAQYTLVS